MSDELLSGRDTWNQLAVSAPWGDTPRVGVAVAMLFGMCFRVTFLRFTMVNHHVSPPIGELFKLFPIILAMQI